MVVERGRSRATASARSRKSLQIPQPPPPPTQPTIRPSVLPFKNYNWMWFQLSTIHSRNTFEIWRSRRASSYLHLRKSSWFALHLSCTNDAISPFTLAYACAMFMIEKASKVRSLIRNMNKIRFFLLEVKITAHPPITVFLGCLHGPQSK